MTKLERLIWAQNNLTWTEEEHVILRSLIHAYRRGPEAVRVWATMFADYKDHLARMFARVRDNRI
jgi:hypothetical protein